jgi:hypothetical protein
MEIKIFIHPMGHSKILGCIRDDSWFFITITSSKIGVHLTPKILSDQIWIAGYFGQSLTYP